MHKNGPRALSASVRIQFSVVVSTMLGRRPGVRNGPPATQAKTATAPSCASTASNSASTERSSTTSTTKALCPVPASAPAARRASPALEVGQRDRVSVAGKRLRCGFADAAPGAGNDCDPVHQFPHAMTAKPSRGRGTVDDFVRGNCAPGGR
jgi:hypothetical protein